MTRTCPNTRRFLRDLSVAVVLLSACTPSIGGIHVRMGYSEESGLRIVDVPHGGGGYEAGLQEGDRISAIDDVPVRSMSMQEVVEKLRGPVGSRVELVVIRDQEMQTITVERTPYAR